MRPLFTNNRTWSLIAQFLNHLIFSKRLKIMIMLLLVGASCSYAQELFKQDFSSSSTVSSYVSTTPGTGQFTYIGAFTPNDVLRTIENGALTFEKTTSSSAYGVASRNVDFPGPPDAISFGFDINVSGVSVNTSSGVTVGFGNGFPASSSNPSTSAFYLRSQIELTTTGFTINSQAFTGNQRVNYYLNNSGVSITYIAPNGIAKNLANDKCDVWVGSTQVITGASVTTST